MAKPPSLDQFRHALAGATRAIARDAEADVMFGSEGAGPGGKTARVASPGPSLDPRLVAEARGGADAAIAADPSGLWGTLKESFSSAQALAAGKTLAAEVIFFAWLRRPAASRPMWRASWSMTVIGTSCFISS